MALKDLFFLNRFPEGGALFLLLFYIPCGLLLVIFRFFFGLQLLAIMSILPKQSLVKRILLRVSCCILGVAVTQEGTAENYKKDQHKLVISNHVTHLDNVAIETIVSSVMPLNKCDCPWLIKWVLGYREFDGDKEKENMDNGIKEYLQESSFPLLVFPEEQITNGKRGLLKFNPWGFQFSDTVLPVLISVRRPLMVQIAAHVLGSGWWQDFVWFMFVPYTHFHIRVLRPLELTSNDFGDVQKHMASALGVEATNYSSEDVVELIKEIEMLASKTVLPAPTQTSHPTAPKQEARINNASPNTRLTRMVKQVREVLPQVPSTVIARDLSRTHCVDTTLTNILEGRLSYVPEKEINHTDTCNDINRGSKAVSDEAAPTKPQTVTFSRFPEERQKLLSQRKAMMLESARRRFIGTMEKES